MSLCKKVILLKAQGLDPWARRVPWGHKEGLIIYCVGGGGKDEGKFPMIFSYAKEHSQDGGGLAIVKIKLFFPLVKH